MSDLIDRQAAIDALSYCQTYLFDTMDKDNKISREDAEYAIEQLPSAQPKIIRCRECKHRRIEDAVWVCPFGISGGPNFYCAYGRRWEDD